MGLLFHLMIVMRLSLWKVSGQNLGPGTLYGAITRLEGREWIAPLPSEERRRPYRLTNAGRRVLRHRLEAMKAMMKVGSRRLADA